MFDPESGFLFLPPIFFKLNKKNRGRHNIIGTQIRCSSVAAGRSVFLPNYGNARYMYRGLSVIAGTTVSIYRSVLESEYESFCVLEFHDRMYGISNFFQCSSECLPEGETEIPRTVLLKTCRLSISDQINEKTDGLLCLSFRNIH